MLFPFKPHAVLAIAMLVASSTSLPAQGRMAPGSALPGNMGGIGLGGTLVAPGPATGSLIEQEGPGGIPLASGPLVESQPSSQRTRRARHPVRGASGGRHLR
jgi:hypothetical protein